MQVDTAHAEDWTDIPQLPELPRARQRWTVRRKAAVIEAVRDGWMQINEARVLYNTSIDEFVAWGGDLDRYGIPVCVRRATKSIEIPKRSRRELAIFPVRTLKEDLALRVPARPYLAAQYCRRRGATHESSSIDDGTSRVGKCRRKRLASVEGEQRF